MSIFLPPPAAALPPAATERATARRHALSRGLRNIGLTRTTVSPRHFQRRETPAAKPHGTASIGSSGHPGNPEMRTGKAVGRVCAPQIRTCVGRQISAARVYHIDHAGNVLFGRSLNAATGIRTCRQSASVRVRDRQAIMVFAESKHTIQRADASHLSRPRWRGPSPDVQPASFAILRRHTAGIQKQRYTVPAGPSFLLISPATA